MLSGREALSHLNLNCKIKKTYRQKGIRKTVTLAFRSLYNENDNNSNKKVSVSRSNFAPNSEIWFKSLAR